MIIKVVGITIVATMTVLIGLAGFAVATAPGAAMLVPIIARSIPGELVVDELRGSLLTELRAERVVYRLNETQLQFLDVRLALNIFALASRRISIDYLMLDSIALDDRELDIAVEVDGVVRLAPAWPLAVAVTWTLNDGAVAGEGRFDGDLERVEFVHRLLVPEQVDINGRIDSLLDTPRLVATANWSEVGFPASQFGELSSREGSASISGSLDSYEFDSSMSLIRGGDAVARAIAHGRGTGDAVELEALELTELAGGATARAQGRIELGDALAVDLSVAGERFDPAVLVPGFDGRLGFNADVNWRSPATVAIELVRLDGQFLGAPVAASGDLSFADGALVSVAGLLQSDNNRLRVAATGGDVLAGEFDIDARQLATLWPGLTGHLRGSGKLAGTASLPDVSMDLVGEVLAYEGQRVERLRVLAAIDAEDRIDWDIQATGIEVAQRSIGNLRATARGLTGDHRVEIDLTDGPIELSASSSGSWQDFVLQEQVQAVELKTAIGAWTLRSPAMLSVASDRFTVSAHCWDSVPAAMCVGETAMIGERWQTAVELTRFPLETVNGWLGDDVAWYGEADAKLNISRDIDALTAELDWVQTDTRVRYIGEQQDAMIGTDAETQLQQVELHVVATEEVLRLDGNIAGDYGLELELSGAVYEPLTESGALEGRLRAVIPDISELRPLIDRYFRTAELAGTLELEARVAGTRAAPVIEGRGRLYNASVQVVDLGIDVSAIELSVIGDGIAPLALEGTAVSGQGRVSLSGIVDWSANDGIFSDISISGQDFEIVRLPDLTMSISPEIEAHLDNDLVTLSGSVFVPTAAVELQTLGGTAVPISTDVIVHDIDESTEESSSRVVGAVEIELGDAVSFAGLGVTTRLSGGMTISQEADGAPIRGKGSLQLVDGRYEAFGREMIIERGSLNFLGPLSDPVLDVRASRRLRYEREDIKVGIQLSGNVSQTLDFILFSEPGMSEADVLSFLVVGQPATTTAGVDNSAISGAAVAMGLSTLTRGMEGNLSLDEISFEGGTGAEGGNDTAFVAGKQLSETVYVRYTYGLFSRVGTFIVRYDIGRGVSIEAGSGAQQSLDLIYSIDR